MTEQDINIKTIFDRAGGYSPSCLPFIRDGLAHTVEAVHGRTEMELMELEDEHRHVTGQQLCVGLRDYAVRQYGMLAKTVLNKWGIHETKDFGQIIFAMVDAGLMRKTDEDTLEDFDGVYEFDEAFAEPAMGNGLETAGS